MGTYSFPKSQGDTAGACHTHTHTHLMLLPPPTLGFLSVAAASNDELSTFPDSTSLPVLDTHAQLTSWYYLLHISIPH